MNGNGNLVFFFPSTGLECILSYFLTGSRYLPFHVGILCNNNVLHLSLSGFRITPISELRNIRIAHVKLPDDSLRDHLCEYALRFKNLRYGWRSLILAGLAFFFPSRRLANLVRDDTWCSYHCSAWVSYIYRVFCCDLCPHLPDILTTPVDLYHSPLVELPE